MLCQVTQLAAVTGWSSEVGIRARGTGSHSAGGQGHRKATKGQESMVRGAVQRAVRKKEAAP